MTLCERRELSSQLGAHNFKRARLMSQDVVNPRAARFRGKVARHRQSKGRVANLVDARATDPILVGFLPMKAMGRRARDRWADKSKADSADKACSPLAFFWSSDALEAHVDFWTAQVVTKTLKWEVEGRSCNLVCRVKLNRPRLPESTCQSNEVVVLRPILRPSDQTCNTPLPSIRCPTVNRKSGLQGSKRPEMRQSGKKSKNILQLI